MAFLSPQRASAKVSDGSLILSLPGAKNPLVWRLDLRQVTSSAFEVREDDNGFTLILRGEDGKTRDIAPFYSRRKAVAALMAAGTALEEPQTQAVKKGGIGKWILCAFLALFILIALRILSAPAIQTATFGTPAPAEQTAPAAPAPRNGVPVPADDFLRGR